MARQILVALKSEDRLSQMIPYLEKIAQPGMKVVFLIRFSPPTASKTLPPDSIELEYPEESAFFEKELEKPRFTRENGGTEAMEEQRLAVEHKVFLALEALRKRGIELTVDIYTGSLRRAVKSYTRKGDVHLIVMRARRELMMMDFLQKAFPVFGLFKRPAFAPILVLRPTHAV
jgi:hypothetical protein